jgi:gamma-glutamylcyclotransferase (GGCT)/AIG2-like uncharacterized protein YtfP
MNDDQELLFVYGTLMDSAKRVMLLGRHINASAARLHGYARGEKRFPFVAKQADAVTDGAILEGLTAHDLAILDDYEEVPKLYSRERIKVVVADDRKVECWIYIPTDWANE